MKKMKEKKMWRLMKYKEYCYLPETHACFGIGPIKIKLCEECYYHLTKRVRCVCFSRLAYCESRTLRTYVHQNLLRYSLSLISQKYLFWLAEEKVPRSMRSSLSQSCLHISRGLLRWCECDLKHNFIDESWARSPDNRQIYKDENEAGRMVWQGGEGGGDWCILWKIKNLYLKVKWEGRLHKSRSKNKQKYKQKITKKQNPASW